MKIIKTNNSNNKKNLQKNEIKIKNHPKNYKSIGTSRIPTFEVGFYPTSFQFYSCLPQEKNINFKQIQRNYACALTQDKNCALQRRP